MLTLARAMVRDGAKGEPLPTVFPSLEHAGIRPRRGQVTMLAGQPNCGKSMLALWFAIRMGVPALYISADTDAATMCVRAAAMKTGQASASIEAAMRQGGAAYYEDLLEGFNHVRFTFDPSPTLDDIDLEIAAYEELMGQYPAAVFIDNAINIAFDNGDEWSSIRELSKVFHHLARTTGSAFFILHHATESEGNALYPPARKAIQGKISQMPELILTLARDEEEFRVACVKNRSGFADPTAKRYMTLVCNMDTGRFADTKFELLTLGEL